MIIKRQNLRLFVTLPQECTIGKVEADADKLWTKLKGIKSIDISGGGVEEMDTAYLQLLLSLVSTAEAQGIEIHIGQRSEAMDNILMIYGENLARAEEDTLCPDRS